MAKTTEIIDSLMVERENSFKKRLFNRVAMRRLFVCFYIIDQLVYITLDIAGVGKCIILQKGFFAYKGDEKCISHKNLLQRFDINAYKMPLI